MAVMSSKDFEQDGSAAMKAAASGPVFIVDGGVNSYVLLTVEEYVRLGGKGPKIADLFYTPGAADIEFDPPKIEDLPKPVDFS
ncbi:type II toxin-antitoxin system Phd/YefM family antitoxin [Rhizobium sp. BE258]|jgi:hypothetical protein|uniref:type II toxin-antitoxin system Phd/YefM family antitoxin n=1 Tax=Rhizobium sp. BE258 TaxID=2817722 RepID=UPI002864BFC8|nr:type II toxin-antitoxin system Phd/YefM family antitoxin [Rhizobium sp. BE258]MDR7144223.1 hypothetical protein [Rhizobium sp. BE258]